MVKSKKATQKLARKPAHSRPKEVKNNPFEIHTNKRKHDILGRKLKHDTGLPGISRSKAIKKVGILWYVVKYNKWIIRGSQRRDDCCLPHSTQGFITFLVGGQLVFTSGKNVLNWTSLQEKRSSTWSNHSYIQALFWLLFNWWRNHRAVIFAWLPDVTGLMQ